MIITTPEQLAQRISATVQGQCVPDMHVMRHVLVSQFLECAICGTAPGTNKAETYGQCFERIFGEPLMGARKRG